MQVVVRDPNKGYLDCYLWVPRSYINVEGTKRSLTHVFTEYGGAQKVITLYQEAPHHLLVPRAFWEPGALPFEVVDCRPLSHTLIPFVSRVQLDHRVQLDTNGQHALLPTGEDVQRKSFNAMQEAMGGVLQLGCVSGDTVICVNRAGKGFKTTVAKALRSARSTWRSDIPTYIRADVGERIGLVQVLAFLPKGERLTYCLKLENESELRLTGDHEVLTPRGYVPLNNLSVGDVVVVEGSRKGSARKKKIAYRRLGGFDHHPYSRFQTRSHVIEEHRAVAEAELNGLSLDIFRARCKSGDTEGLSFIDPEHFHVHHKDENIYNNVPDNLEVVPTEEHLRKHRPGFKAFGYGELHHSRVVSIKEHGIEPVYDIACVAPHHNFVANGVVVHNCGKGKTCIALHHIAESKVPALVMVDNTQLMEQWSKEIEHLIEVPGGVGLIAEGQKDWRRGLVLGTYISVANWADTMPEEVRRWFGNIYWDEGHHLSAPVFSKTAALFYGRRYCLTATPERDDGFHIIADMHVGKVLHKDLRQPLKSRFIFYWTGLELDLADPNCDVLDKNQEVHTSKVFKYFGRWRTRLGRILQDCTDAVQAGRKVLVVCSSVDEVVNLMALWTRGPNTPLITDVPYPSPQDVGETLLPYALGPVEAQRLQRNVEKQRRLVGQARTNGTSPQRLQEMEERLVTLETDWARFKVYQKLEYENDRRRRTFIRALTPEPSTAGFMTAEVPAVTRQEFVRTRLVTFAIMKYGKEGLDAPHLDTILVSTPFSNRGGLQQLMGRITGRPLPGKKTCLVVFYRDNIGIMHGMCDKLEKHLRQWPIDEGGPLEHEYMNHPKRKQWQKTASLKDAFGQ